MLKFMNDRPVYEAETGCVNITGLSGDRALHCHITKAAILARAGLNDADINKLMAIFTRHRQFFEDVASVLSMREDGVPIIVDEHHLSEPIFAHWQNPDHLPKAPLRAVVSPRRLSA